MLGSAYFSQFQSANMKGHSTETALLEVLDIVYRAANDKAGQFWLASTCSGVWQSTMGHYFNSCSRSLTLQEHCWSGSSRTSKAGLSLSVCRHLCSGTNLPSGAICHLLQSGWWCNHHDDYCHQYANDMQLYLAMSVDNTAAGLSVLTVHTVGRWRQNSLQLNQDKLDALMVSITNQLCHRFISASSVSNAGMDNLVA